MRVPVRPDLLRDVAGHHVGHLLRDLPHRHPHAVRGHHHGRPVAVVVHHQPHHAVHDHVARVWHVHVLRDADGADGVLGVVLCAGDEGEDVGGDGCGFWGAECGGAWGRGQGGEFGEGGGGEGFGDGEAGVCGACGEGVRGGMWGRGCGGCVVGYGRGSVEVIGPRLLGFVVRMRVGIEILIRYVGFFVMYIRRSLKSHEEKSRVKNLTSLYVSTSFGVAPGIAMQAAAPVCESESPTLSANAARLLLMRVWLL